MPANTTQDRSRLKILFYTHGLVDGGGERLWACLATAFKDRGYDVGVVVDFEAEDNRHNLHPDIPLHVLGKGHIGAVMRLAKLLREERPDITLAAIGGSNIKLLAANLLAGRPTTPIISYHGECEYRSGILSYLSYIGLPIISRIAPKTIAVSEGLEQTLVTRWGADPRNIACIYNPVFFPENAPVPTPGELAAREDVILSVGRFVVEKDFVTLVRAFARMNRRSARLLILGKGPQMDRVKAEVRRLGIEERVSMPGYAREPWQAYRTAKCFVSSSVSEPFGNVVVEALAHGLPVVATACAGPHEILLHGTHGRIVGLRNEIQMARAIEATLDNTGDPQSRRERADEFSFEARVPLYEALIRDVLAEKTRRERRIGAAEGALAANVRRHS
ncbi:MAG: glycosyltransferase [Hyphomicrobium sp.]|nr:glycosyltransferase [Hyphomicrobium sp.]